MLADIVAKIPGNYTSLAPNSTSFRVQIPNSSKVDAFDWSVAGTYRQESCSIRNYGAHALEFLAVIACQSPVGCWPSCYLLEYRLNKWLINRLKYRLVMRHIYQLARCVTTAASVPMPGSSGAAARPAGWSWPGRVLPISSLPGGAWAGTTPQRPLPSPWDRKVC